MRLPLEGSGLQKLPFYSSFLPDQDAVTQFEEQSHDGRKESRHDHQCGVYFSIFRPALRPTEVPAKARPNTDSLRDDQRQKRSAQPHEQSDEDIWHGRGNGDAEDEVTLASAKRSGNIKV